MISINDSDYKKIYNRCDNAKFKKATHQGYKIIKLGSNIYIFDKERIINSIIIPESKINRRILFLLYIISGGKEEK